MCNHFSDVTMYQVEVPNVPGDLGDGEVVAGDVLQALWLHLEHDLEEENGDNNDGQEEEESGSDGESVGGSCSNPEEMNEDFEEEPPGLLPDEDDDEDEEENEDEDHDQEVGHVGRAKRITRKRITVGDTMNDDDYR